MFSYKKQIIYPEMGKTPSDSPDTKPFIHNILPITPAFPIFCGLEIISPESNSFEPRNLARSHKKYRDIDMHLAAALTQLAENSRAAALNPKPVSPRTRELDSPRL
jgi:hypothetical protein